MNKTVIYSSDMSAEEKAAIINKFKVAARGNIYEFSDNKDWTNCKYLGTDFADVFKKQPFKGSDRTEYLVSDSGQVFSDDYLTMNGGKRVAVRTLYMIIPNGQEELDPKTGRMVEKVSPVTEKIRLRKAKPEDVKKAVKPLGNSFLKIYSKASAAISRDNSTTVLSDDELNKAYMAKQREIDIAESRKEVKRVLLSHGIRESRASQLAELCSLRDFDSLVERRDELVEHFAKMGVMGMFSDNPKHWDIAAEQYLFDHDIKPDEEDIKAMNAALESCKDMSGDEKEQKLPWYHDIKVYVTANAMVLADRKENTAYRVAYENDDSTKEWDNALKKAKECGRLSEEFMVDTYDNVVSKGNGICAGSVKELTIDAEKLVAAAFRMKQCEREMHKLMDMSVAPTEESAVRREQETAVSAVQDKNATNIKENDTSVRESPVDNKEGEVDNSWGDNSAWGKDKDEDVIK